jgi:hypothetical protein
MTDRDLDEIEKQLRGLAHSDLQNYVKAKELLNNSQDAAVLTMQIDNNDVTLLLVHVEVIELFHDFLQLAIEYYQGEC